MSAEGSKRAIVAALVANLGIAVAKFVAFLVTRSASMLAESVHSLADTSNQGLLLLGGRKSRRPATEDHPFGFGRERFFWSFVVALVLFSMGSVFALFEGYEKLVHPHELESPAVAVGVLLVAIVLESFSLRTAVQESRHAKGDCSWWQFIRTARTPELPVVLLEDTAALAGLGMALVAVVLAMVTGEEAFDAVGTLGIGVLLGVVAVILMVEMKGLLIGESASAADQRRIREALESHPRVLRVIHMRTEHLGPDELLVGAKLEFEPTLTAAEIADVVNEAEDAVRGEVPAVRVMYLEPDVLRRG